jgi:hypothetical protein
MPIPVIARSQTQVGGCSLVVNAGSNPAGKINVFLLLSVIYYQVEFYAMGRPLIQRSPTECDQVQQ